MTPPSVSAQVKDNIMGYELPTERKVAEEEKSTKKPWKNSGKKPAKNIGK